MDGHTVVTVCLGGSHLDSHPKSLQHLVRTHANDMQPHHLQEKTQQPQHLMQVHTAPCSGAFRNQHYNQWQIIWGGGGGGGREKERGAMNFHQKRGVQFTPGNISKKGRGLSPKYLRKQLFSPCRTHAHPVVILPTYILPSIVPSTPPPSPSPPHFI